MLTQQHILPLLTSTVKSSLFTHVHSTPFSSAARWHQCHANHSHILTMARLFPDRLHICMCVCVYVYTCMYTRPPLPTVLLSVVSVTCSQPQSENSKWKIPEVNSSKVLNCAPPLLVVWGNLTPSPLVPPRIWIILLSSISTLCTLLPR